MSRQQHCKRPQQEYVQPRPASSLFFCQGRVHPVFRRYHRACIGAGNRQQEKIQHQQQVQLTAQAEACVNGQHRKCAYTQNNVYVAPETEIAERNPDLKDVVDSVDFVQFAASRENAEILRQLIELFSEKKLHHVSPDILGDAYEWILRYFAPTKAKEGEIYTPREVIKLLIKILDPKPEESVYDPACGSAGMLIMSYKHIEDAFGKTEANKLFLYGQEVNQKTIALAKMNMYIHDIRDSHLEFGDTFLYPKFKDGSSLRKFDETVFKLRIEKCEV